MKFETLKPKRKIILIAAVFVLVVTTLILNVTKAKYRTTESIPIAKGTINYSFGDFNLMGVYIQDGENYTASDTIPESGYTLNSEKSYCKKGDTELDTTITYDTETKALSITPLTDKGTKCYLYFDVIKDESIPIINEVTTTVSTTSINVIVNASDNIGVTGYYYNINDGEYKNSTSNTYTFENLKSGTPYTIKVYAVDNAGNQSEIISKSITTEKTYAAREAILANITTITTRSSFSSTYTSSTSKTIYTAEDNDGTSYYFAGSPTDNWVKFGGFYWRIVRINGDGSIRLIYNGTSTATTGEETLALTSTAYNSSINNNMYVGYMYTSGQVHGLGTSSNVKTQLESWYTSNLESYGNYIDINAGFCNDRTSYTNTTGTTSGGGTGTTETYYGAYTRLYSKKTPTLKCVESSDLFTVSEAVKGNAKLSKPIGLITADEVVYAGGVHITDNTSYYLYNNQNYWTMSPCSYPYAYIFSVNHDGWLYLHNPTSLYGIRPVINLHSDVILTGSGTTSSPYQVS